MCNILTPPVFDQRAFMEQLRFFVKHSGVSLRKFAIFADISTMTLHRAFIGKQELRLSTVKKLSDAMDRLKA